MLRFMYSGVSGMRNHQVRMDVIGNNISNVNTTGFKTGRANFQDTLYQTMGAAGTAAGYQVGTGVNVGSVSNNFNQGPLQATGRTLDLGIMGQGFFGLLDENDDLKYFTRDGSFFIDKEGNLVNSNGLRVAKSDNDPITISLETEQTLDDLIIDEKGDIYVKAGTEQEEPEYIGSIGLFNFTNPSGLTRAGDNLFLANGNTGEMTSNDRNEGDPILPGFGQIRSGFLEMSNIDIAEELANLITSQRGFQANAKVFTTADEVLQELVQLKR